MADVPPMLSFPSFSLRLATYATWPAALPIQPLEFCLAGFRYTGNSDVVLCCFCNTRLHNWPSSSKPMEAHKPTCTYVKAFKEFYHLSTYEGRLQTFKNWGGSEAETYARAGFYFTGETLRYVTKQHIFLPNVRLQTLALRPGPVVSKRLVEEKKAAENGYFYSGVYQRVIHTDVCVMLDMDLPPKKIDGRIVCKVCLDDEMNVLFLPCRHLAVCISCSNELEECCICRSEIFQRIRVFM
ncbi:baculoviral IAP repeat-containing protein 3-like [Diabrotica virgifera virgifera]|uniref:RING-type domain-containing protein n=1 Tax=Diabrotica virgifera virgifera TaxID=50390 RepID=A0ABM5L728_DIAVI|nr:baculoviral IAP repeat-containing protein 3-like [Diabrotica virgifera virgifera]